MNNNYNPPPYGPGRPPGSPYVPGRPSYVPPHLQQPETGRYKKAIRKNANVACAGLVIAWVIMLFVSSAVYLLMDAFIPVAVVVEHGALIDVIYQAIVYMLAFITPLVFMVKSIKIPPRIAFPMGKTKFSIWFPGIFFCLGLNIVGGILASIINIFLESSFGVVQTYNEPAIPAGTFGMVLYFIYVAVLPAILEEMVFRGVIMQSLRRFGDAFALITSSILFSMCHGNLIQGPPTLFIGLAIGYFVLRTGSLKTGMIIHFANNALAVTLSMLTQGATDAELITINATVMAAYLLFGVAAFIYLKLRHNNMFQVMPSRLPLAEGKKYSLFFTSAFPIVYIIFTIGITMMFFEVL